MSRKPSREPAAEEDSHLRAQRLIGETTREERRLLSAELEAEKKVLKARARFAKAADRLARRRTRLSDAEQVLMQCQEDRVAGPQISNADR